MSKCQHISGILVLLANRPFRPHMALARCESPSGESSPRLPLLTEADARIFDANCQVCARYDRLMQLGNNATHGMTAMEVKAKAVFAEARECFGSAASGPELHGFVEDYVGPIKVGKDGELVRGRP